MTHRHAINPNKEQFCHDRLVDVLSCLKQIGLSINEVGNNQAHTIESILEQISKSTAQAIPGTVTVLYTYDPETKQFVTDSKISSGHINVEHILDGPRPDGMGWRAVNQSRSILSYEETDLEPHPAFVLAGAKAAACYPMIASGYIIGVVYVYHFESQRFSQLDLLLLENFVTQASLAVFHTTLTNKARKDLIRKGEEVTRLQRASLLISSRQKLEDTLDTILQMALEVTNARYGCFRLVDRRTNNLITAAIAGETLSRPVTENLPIDTTSVMGWVAFHRQPVCIANVKSEPWNAIYQPLDHDLDIHSELTVPLIGASGRLEGVLNLESPQKGGFNEDDNHLLQAFAAQAVIAIQEALLIDALQEIAEQLLSMPIDHVLNHLAERACDLLNAAAGAIWSLNGDSLILEAASSGHQHGETIPLKTSLIGQAVLKQKPVISSDVRIDPVFQMPELARRQGWVRALVVPLMISQRSNQKPVGAFSVYSTESTHGQFTRSDWDKKVLTILAHYATLAVQNASRQEAVQTAQNQRMISETFAAMGDVAANLLHQLNNIFGSIPVRIEGIEDKCVTSLSNDLYLANNLSEIKKSARQAMNTVRENLKLLHPIQVEPIHILDCLQLSIASCNLTEDISITTNNLDELPPVQAGKQNLSLVFSNLLENASHAMNQQGDINISGKVRGDNVILSVTDNGPGIPFDLQSSIFELNYSGSQIDRPHKLGFGLWWVKALMTRLGGRVWVESDGSSGTTFHLSLPIIEHVQEESTLPLK